MERCPNCRARWDGNAACRRCGMELAALVEVERVVAHSIAKGIAHLAADDPEAAIRVFTRVLGLRREPFVEQLLGFARQGISRRPTSADSVDGHSASPRFRD